MVDIGSLLVVAELDMVHEEVDMMARIVVVMIEIARLEQLAVVYDDTVVDDLLLADYKMALMALMVLMVLSVLMVRMDTFDLSMDVPLLPC